MTPPLISVVIPCFNREEYIQEAVDSALAQTWPAVEVIVVDDGSTDGSVEILESYRHRITLICQENAGVAAARNAGIARASGTWVALLDSDDVWLPEKLEHQMALADRWPEVVLLHTKCATIGTDGTPYGTPSEAVDDRLETDSLERLMHHCEPTTSSVVIRRETLKAVKGFDVEFEQNGGFAAEDWELYIRVAECGSFAFAGSILTYYRVHAESKSLGNKLRHTLGLVALRERIESKRSRWLTEIDRPSLNSAIKVHTGQYAHVLGRLGLIYSSEKQWTRAANAYRRAINIEPSRLKHRLRWIGAVIRKHLAGEAGEERRAS